MSFGSADNPYSPSPIAPPPPVMQYNPANEIFRSGNLLVVHKLAKLPDRCLKTNEPTNDRLIRKLTWHHPVVYLALLINVLAYVVVAMLVRKTATLHIPLTADRKKRRLLWMITAWLLFFLGVAFLILGLILMDQNGNNMAGLLVVLFPILLLTAALIGIFGCRVVVAKKIDDHFVWLGGVCDDFRSGYPEFPYAPPK